MRDMCVRTEWWSKFSRVYVITSICAVLLSLVTPVWAQTSPDGALAAEFQVEFNGRAMARDTIEIFPQVDGTVTEAVAQVGRWVKKNDPLLQIDPRLYQYAFDHATAVLNNARVHLQTVNGEIKRIKGLVDKKLISTNNLYTLTIAQTLAQGSAEQAEVRVKIAELELEQTTIRSPIDGFVSRINVDVGDTVGPKMMGLNSASYAPEPALVILEYNPIRVTVEIDPVRSRNFRSDINADKLEITEIALKFADGSIYPHRGKYVGSSYQVSPKTGKVDHTVLFPNAELLVFPGSTVIVVITYRRME